MNNNKWVWDNTTFSGVYPEIIYGGSPADLCNGGGANGTTNSIISSTTGSNQCGGPLFPIIFGPNIHAVLTDPVQQWRADYYYEVQRQNTGQGNDSVASQTIKRIILIENEIGQQNFVLANALMNGLNPSNAIEQNYKTVLTLLINIQTPNPHEPNPNEVAALTLIAEQTPRLAGPAVYLARNVLFFYFHTTFRDEDSRESDAVRGIATIQTPCCLTPASGTTLGFIDQSGNDLPISGAMVQTDGSFSFDPFQLDYYNHQAPGTLYRIYAKAPSKFTVLDRDFKTLPDWISASPLYITLGGAKLDTTKVTAQPDTVIAQQTSVHDLSGNIYSIGVSNNQSADFLVEKRNSNGQLIWSRVFDGPSSGNDTATCIALDGHGNTFIAGKVWNENHCDFQVIKYDSTGFMQWESIIADTLPRQNEPTGICVNPVDETVCIIGKCCNQSQMQYRMAKYTQCLTVSSNRITQNENLPETISMIEFYPNPSDGKLMVVLKNNVGGILELFNVSGQLVSKTEIIQSGEINLPASDLENGLYLLKFTSVSDHTQFGKLIIQRNQ